MTTATAQNESLKNQLAQRAETTQQPDQKKPPTIADFLKRMQPEIARAVPKSMDPERLARIALTTIRMNPELQKCSLPSLLGAVMQSAQLGLEPGILGHCYYVPFNVKIKDKATGRERYEKVVQFIIGYRGYLDLIRRSGLVQSLSVHEVYAGDVFEFEYGLNEKLVHKPNVDIEPNPEQITHVYAVAHFKDGGYQVMVMSRKQIETVRKRSKAANSGPWVTDYAAMARKTVLRQFAKYLPMTIEVQRQLAQDETVKTELAEDMTEVPTIIDLSSDAYVQVEDGPITAAQTEAAAGATEASTASEEGGNLFSGKEA